MVGDAGVKGGHIAGGHSHRPSTARDHAGIGLEHSAEGILVLDRHRDQLSGLGIAAAGQHQTLLCLCRAQHAVARDGVHAQCGGGGVQREVGADPL